jgi:ankyrin repeat protein
MIVMLNYFCPGGDEINIYDHLGWYGNYMYNVRVITERCDGLALLTTASSHGYYDCVKLLLDHGADINRSVQLHEFPMLYNAFTIALYNIDYDIMKLLTDMGADINIHDSSHYTPLTYAVEKRSYKNVKYLLNLGADVNVPSGEPYNNVLYTPLHYAIRNFDINIVTLLLERGADPYIDAMINGEKLSTCEMAYNTCTYKIIGNLFR